MAMATALPADSFEKMGLHTNVCVALSAKGIHGPRPQQAAALMNTTRDLCDVLGTVQPHSGRHTLLISFAAHCVLAANMPKFALIVASTSAAATKLSNVAKMLNIGGVTPFLVLDPADKSRTSGCVTPSIVITTLPTVMKWTREEFLKCASLLVEDTAASAQKELESVMHSVSNAADPMNMFLLTTQLPHEVPVSIRYALHRRHRRFCPTVPLPPAFSFLLATDHDDRLHLLRKIVQIKNLRRILVLTHSKEVKDLRMKLQQWGLNTFALGRNAAANEQSVTINDFISSTYGVLVTSDAYSGVDLLDVDGVIQYYPPQKSMDEEEWSDFVRCLRTTSHPMTPTRFITLLGTDDFTLGAYFMKRAECDGLILNVTPNHPRFADIVLNPLPAAAERVGQPLPGNIDSPKPAGGGKGNKDGNKQNNNNNNNNAASATAASGKKDASGKGGDKSNNNNNASQKGGGKSGNAQPKKDAPNKGKDQQGKTSNAGTPATTPTTAGAGEEVPLSNRAKRRLAQEEARKKAEARDAALKAKKSEAKDASPKDEKKADDKAHSPADSDAALADGSGESKSKRQLRRENQARAATAAEAKVE